MTNSPCAGNSAVVSSLLSPADQIAICRIPVGLTPTQCTAPLACNDGWELCRASTYKNLAGEIPLQLPTAWIGGCIREAGDPLMAPLDRVCGACTTDDGFGVSSAWSCNTSNASFWSPRQHVGLTTSS